MCQVLDCYHIGCQRGPKLSSPLCCEVNIKVGLYDRRKLVGVTAIDAVRTSVFYARQTGQSVTNVQVPVVGGCGGDTEVPLFSQATPNMTCRMLSLSCC